MQEQGAVVLGQVQEPTFYQGDIGAGLIIRLSK
jgi:hypothetical protein